MIIENRFVELPTECDDSGKTTGFGRPKSTWYQHMSLFSRKITSSMWLLNSYFWKSRNIAAHVRPGISYRNSTVLFTRHATHPEFLARLCFFMGKILVIIFLEPSKKIGMGHISGELDCRRDIFLAKSHSLRDYFCPPL